jgi:hypothetical protein
MPYSSIDQYPDLKKPVRPGGRPRRTKEDYKSWQEANGRQVGDPVPIYPNVKPSRDIVWNSVGDIVNYVRGIKGIHPTTYDGGGWNFTTDDVIDLYDRGWEAGYKYIKYHLDEAVRIATEAAIEVEDLVRDVHGSVIDVPTYLSGDPECMFEFKEEVQNVLKLEVDVDFFFGSSSNSDMYMHRGVAIMAAVMALRRLGVFVDLYTREISYARTAVGGYHQNSLHSCTIHLMKQGLTENMTDTLLAVAHPEFNMPLFYFAQSAAWGCSGDQGICSQARRSDDFYPKKGSGKISIPGIWDEGFTLEGDDGVIDWHNFWATPEAAKVMVKSMLQAATPVTRG